MLGPEPPRWEQSLREVGLVALHAAVLTRRIFLPRAGRHDLAPEQWQILLALALSETASPEHPPGSVASLATQLAAHAYVERAGRFLPGWPPERRGDGS